jgi:RimJ/RimL family protein N-acetyltransferase
MMYIGISATDEDLAGIIQLQQTNLPVNLSKDEIQQQGFVTIQHSMANLQQMHRYEKNIIAKDGENIAGYLLAMTEHSKADIPVLVPMFEVFDEIVFKGKSVAEYKYIVVGQVCIGKAYRGQGLLDKCYAAYRDHFMSRYDFAITEIATSNQRSINAHKRIGFKEVHCYTDPQQTAWSIVIWDWGKKA